MQWNQLIPVVVGMVLDFFILESCLEYQEKKIEPFIKYSVYGIYLIQFCIAFFKPEGSYVLSGIFFGVLLVGFLVPENSVCIAYAVSISIQFWLICGLHTRELLYNLFVGLGICVLVLSIGKGWKDALSIHLANMIHSMIVVLVCDLLFTNQVVIKNLFFVGGWYVISAILAWMAQLLLLYFWKRLRQADMQKYLDENFPLICRIREQDVLAVKQQELAVKLCSQAAEQIQADTLVAALGGRYYNLGMITEDGLLGALQLCEEYSLPKLVKKMLKEYYLKQGNATTKESAIVLLAGTTIATLTQALKKGQVNISMKRLLSAVFLHQLEQGCLQDRGLSLEEFLKVFQVFETELTKYKGRL